MQQVLDHLRAASGGIYTIDLGNPDPRIISNPNSKYYGYNRLFNTAKNYDNGIASQYKLGLLKDYRDSNVNMVSNELTTNVKDNSKKLPTAGWFDAINTLEVLGKDKKINKSKLKSWDTWDPYKDDLIALYFYDVSMRIHSIPFGNLRVE